MRKYSVLIILVLFVFSSAVDAGQFGSDIKDVQRGTKTIANPDVSGTVTITAVVMAKSFLTVSWLAATDNLHYYATRVVLTNATTLTFTKGASVETATISWEVVEYY